MLTWSVTATPVGNVIAVASKRGLCRVEIGPTRRALEADIRARFPDATLVRDDTAMKPYMAALQSLINGERGGKIATDVDGTEFQKQVWSALRAIPFGKTRTYADIATQIGRPRAVRAVAQACANNPIALVVPCHRVIRSSGELSGYRWGVAVKQALLETEGAI